MKALSKTKLEYVEKTILALLKDFYKKPGRPGVNDPDYAEAFGIHRGFLIANYGRYDSGMEIKLPDGTILKANDWFRSLKEQAEKSAKA